MTSAALFATLFLAAGLQRATGLGLGLVAIAPLTAILGRHTAVDTVVLATLAVSGTAAVRDAGQVSWGDLRIMTPVAAVGVWAAQRWTGHLAAAGAHALVGVVLVALGALLLTGRTPTILTRGAPAGAVSGLCAGLAGVGGPPALLFLARRNLCAQVSLASVQAHSALICLLLTGLQGLPSLPATPGLAMVGGTLAGATAAARVSWAMDTRRLRHAAITLSIAAGIALLITPVG